MKLKLLFCFLILSLYSCAPYVTIHVEGKNKGDKIIYNDHVCYSPCDVKISIPNKTYCDSSYTIETIDKTNEMIRFIQFLGCRDSSIKVNVHEPVHSVW